jgi:hypothetical protein
MTPSSKETAAFILREASALDALAHTDDEESSP